MRRFDIVANCSSNYVAALDFALPSWIQNSGADNIFIYTDGPIENKWGDKVKFIETYEPSTEWVEWANRKPKTLVKYLKEANEGTTFFLTDLDCYAVKSWRYAIENPGWWFKAIRTDKTIEDASEKMAVAVFFGVVCEEMYQFANKWDRIVEKTAKEQPDLIKAIAKLKISGHDQMVFDKLVKQLDVVPLNENIWSNERDDYDEWKKLITKYKNEVRVLHFKGGRWKDPKIVKEILGLLPDVKEYYHEHSNRQKVSARILKIINFIPNYIAGRTVLDVGCGNQLITTCMKVFAKSVKGIDIDDDIYTYKSDVQYDVVTCFDVFEHLHNVPAAIEQVKKFCKPGGFILVNQPELQHPTQPIDNIVPIEALFGLGKLVYLEHYVFSQLIERYNFMVFQI